MSDRPLTPEEQQRLLARAADLEQLVLANPDHVRNDALLKIWGQLLRAADALQALPRIEELLVELVEIQRLRAAMSREYLDQEEAGDEEASKP